MYFFIFIFKKGQYHFEKFGVLNKLRENPIKSLGLLIKKYMLMRRTGHFQSEEISNYLFKNYFNNDDCKT
jgi:hypothetical protein